MDRPKIAVFIDWYLPGTKAGGPVRSVYSMAQLLKNDFSFYIITSNKDLGETQAYKDIKSDTLFSADGLSYYYFSDRNLNTKSVLALISEIQPHLVYLNSFWSFYFSINIIRLKNKSFIKTPVLLAPRGMLGKGALGLKSFKKRVYLLLIKLTGAYKHVSFHATQQQEEQDIRSVFHRAMVFRVPNINSSSAVINKSPKQQNSLKLFFLSRIARVKNLHFAVEALRRVPMAYSIEYDVYGNIEDKGYWAECRELFDTLPPNITFRYIHELPFHEVQKTLCNYHVLLLPTLNENYGHSIVESLLCGCPVIISDQTPWSDVEKYGAGFALSLNNTQGFTEAITRLATFDAEDFLHASKAAINYISNKINHQALSSHYKTMFNECIKN